jgi:hypothetical protein
MKEASYEDAVALGEQLNLHKDDIWRIIRGVRYSTPSDLGLVVHEALKSTGPADLSPGEDRKRGA